MDPNEIKLEVLSKQFEYQKISNKIDECNSIEELRDYTKLYVKLYFKQQEVLTLVSSRMGNP